MQRLSSATAASWEICRQCSVLDSQQSTNLPWSCNRCRYFSPHSVTCWWFPLFVYNVIAVCCDRCTEISVHMNEKCSLRELFRKTTLSSNIWASPTTIMHSDKGLYIRGLHSVLTALNKVNKTVFWALLFIVFLFLDYMQSVGYCLSGFFPLFNYSDLASFFRLF